MLLAAKKGAAPGSKVMFNVTAMNLRDLGDLLKWAGEKGADAVSVTAPYYHPYDQKALTEYFCRVAEMAEGQPLYLYNMPGMTRNPIAASTLRAVADRCPNLKGIKDSSMDFMTLLEYQCEVDKPGFEIITEMTPRFFQPCRAGRRGPSSPWPAYSRDCAGPYGIGINPAIWRGPGMPRKPY